MKKLGESNLKLYNVAVKELEQGRVSDARDKFRRLTFLTPWNKYAYFQLGRCLLKEEEYNGAVEEFGKAISISPSFIEAYFGLSLAHNLLGEFDKAIRVIKKAIEESPHDSNLHYHLGIAYEYGVQKGAGLTHFKKALELNRENAYAHFELGNHYLRVHMEKDAMVHFQSCLETDPEFAPALIRLAQIYEKKGWWKKLSTIYDTLIRAEPHNIDHYIGMIVSSLHRGELRGASKILKNALKLEPKNAKLLAMDIFVNSHLDEDKDTLGDKLDAIEGIIQEHKNTNEKRIQSLYSEINRLKKEKNSLSKKLAEKQTHLQDIEKKVRRLRSKFKKKAREIEKIRGKHKRDEMAEKLAAEATEITHMTIEEGIGGTKKDIDKVKCEIQGVIGKEYWNMLTTDARQFLATAEYLYSLAKEESIDFGLISVELSKAIEVELNDNLIQRFISHLKTIGKQDDFLRGNLRRFAGGKPGYHTKLAYVADELHYPEMKSLSLGQINLLLHDSMDGCTGTELFKAFIKKQCKAPSFFLDASRFPKALESIILKYRNPFAHSQSLRALDFETFRSEIFYGFDGGILVQLLNACGVANA